MLRRTRIIATLGPASESKAMILELLKAGMNIARLNFSHGTYEEFKKLTQNIRALEKETGKCLSILQDLQGPKLRLGLLAEPISVKKGEKITFSTTKEKGCIHLPSTLLPKILKAGNHLLIEDGLLRTKVLSIKGGKINVEVLNDGLLKSHKGVNVPDAVLPPSTGLTAKDKKDLAFGIETLKVDAVALSFVETAADIQQVRKAISKMTKRPIAIIAKIERQRALENLESIIESADGVMVARGDLGIETEPVRVPIEQKRIIHMARKHGKPVIVATQILQSMVENPVPTRAEISDAAHAIFEHADAVMLSNESAVGLYPKQAVQTLARVAEVTEEALFEHSELFPIPDLSDPETSDDESMAMSACHVAEESDAKAIVILTKQGFTAQLVLKHRPKVPVIIVTPNIDQVHKINFLWGANQIVSYKGPFRSEEAKNFLLQNKLLKKGDDIVSITLSDQKRSLVLMKA